MNLQKTTRRSKHHYKGVVYHRCSQRKYSSSFFFGLLTRKYDEKKNKWVIKANVKQIVIASLAMPLLAWLAISVALLTYFKHYKNFEEMDFLDALVAPFDMSAFRVKMGEFNIKQAKLLFKENKYSEAFVTLSSGVARSPNNLEARTWLATIHAKSLHNTEYAANILESKLTKAFEDKDEKYINASILIFALCPSFEEKSLALTEKALREKIITETNAIKIFTSIFTQKNDNIDFFKKASSRFNNNIGVKNFAVKSAALKLMSSGETQKASELLEQYSITSGEVHRIISLQRLFENSKEIEAIKIAEGMLKTGKYATRIYSFLAKLHDDFGNSTESWRAKRMGRLTSGKLPSDIFLLVEKSDFDKLEDTLLSRASKISIITAIRSASDCKNQKVLPICKKAIDKINDKNKVDLLLAYAEALIKFDNVQEAEKILIETSTLNKDISKDSFIEDLKLALALKTQTTNKKQVEDFLKRTSPIKILSFAKMLSDCGLHREAVEKILYAKELKHDLTNVDVMLFTEFFNSGNFQDAARLIAKTNARLPIKLLASADITNSASDKFIFLTDKERNIVLQKVQEAEKKMKAYKAIYKF